MEEVIADLKHDDIAVGIRASEGGYGRWTPGDGNGYGDGDG